MEILQTATGPIAYDERGDGQPLLLLPSGAHDHHDFDELRDLLPTRFRSISLDWPAHGSSPPGVGSASAMRFADVVEEVVAQLARTARSSRATRSAGSQPRAWRSDTQIS